MWRPCRRTTARSTARRCRAVDHRRCSGMAWSAWRKVRCSRSSMGRVVRGLPVREVNCSEHHGRRDEPNGGGIRSLHKRARRAPACARGAFNFNRRGASRRDLLRLAPVVRTRSIDSAFAGRAGRLPSSRRPGEPCSSAAIGSSIGFRKKPGWLSRSPHRAAAVTVVESAIRPLPTPASS